MLKDKEAQELFFRLATWVVGMAEPLCFGWIDG
jgi:hypothetical protein